MNVMVYHIVLNVSFRCVNAITFYFRGRGGRNSGAGERGDTLIVFADATTEEREGASSKGAVSSPLSQSFLWAG